MRAFKLDPAVRPDLADFLCELKQAQAQFLVIGAYAVMSHTGKARATKDLDVFVDGTDENLLRVCKAMGRFGAPSHLCTVEALRPQAGAKFSGVFFGLAPDRIDILSKTALAFDMALARHEVFSMTDLEVPVACRDHLLELKRAAVADDPTRKTDLVDIRALQEPLPSPDPLTKRSTSSRSPRKKPRR
jgi:hypothetical protein